VRGKIVDEILAQIVLKLVDTAPVVSVLVALAVWADRRVLPIVSATFDRQSDALLACQKRLDDGLDYLLDKS